MNGEIKRAPVAAVMSDISCYGRAALGVSIAALSAMGVQCVPLPTSVLSSHTGGFGRPAKADLTDFLGPCMRHWAEIGISFDAVCTGYLANSTQADAAVAFLAMHPQAVKVVAHDRVDHFDRLRMHGQKCNRRVCLR